MLRRCGNSPELDRLVKGVDVGNGTCSITNCDERVHGRGWCSRHYSAWRRTGDPETQVTRHYRTPAEAFAARTRSVGDCLVWVGSKTRDGYGFITVGGRLEMTHRYAWIASRGPIPSGLEVDHTCGNRSCCSVDHLRLASRHQNMRNRAGAQVGSSTGVRNVRAEGERFRVTVNGDYVGTFHDLETARSVAAEARLAKFGEFAGQG